MVGVQPKSGPKNGTNHPIAIVLTGKPPILGPLLGESPGFAPKMVQLCYPLGGLVALGALHDAWDPQSSDHGALVFDRPQQLDSEYPTVDPSHPLGFPQPLR